ncbi:MAG TPA: metal-dependent transcriptional regulator [Desulfobacteraceae bacterium]|nr:metal-dependent transcriptional regulator [Desulfobacteraceae bacterium]
MTTAGALTASLEDYLEAIFLIIAEKQAVRPKDIARRLKVSNSSVTGALRSLAEKGLINYAPYDVISLTPAGKAAASDVARRHEVLRDFFVNVLAINEHEADEAAWKMEHSIPKSILDRFIQFAEFAEVCPRGGTHWISGFGYYCDRGDTQENCEKCISVALEEVKQRKRRRNLKQTATIKLNDLKPGQKGKVVKNATQAETTSPGTVGTVIGVTPGSVVEVERVAPLGSPIDIKIKGYHLSVGKDQADGIEIELLQ